MWEGVAVKQSVVRGCFFRFSATDKSKMTQSKSDSTKAHKVKIRKLVSTGHCLPLSRQNSSWLKAYMNTFTQFFCGTPCCMASHTSRSLKYSKNISDACNMGDPLHNSKKLKKKIPHHLGNHRKLLIKTMFHLYATGRKFFSGYAFAYYSISFPLFSLLETIRN